ncbi:uncharacterized protein [Elaeis guineensis]|uniref:Uncharacterized protein LOC105044011 isoform X2 n=1 Tax=Elaeis guineensis var. tenera TaxID=51953 RepID=A0A6I9RA85_ELAGV|nr:uncharacterized protein LOC105044011 isoform X2 [Elaeis guineensis]
MATELLPWHWIVETLAQVEELDASILETIICRDPDFSKNAPEIVRERVALRYLEKLVPSSSASGVPSTSASFRANEPAVDVLKKVAGLCKLEKDKDKLHAPDLHQFILQKKASLPKSSLQLLSSTLEGHSQLLSSLKEPSGLCIHSRADCLRCSIDDDNQRAKKLRLSRKDAEIQSPKQRSPVTAHDGGTVTLQEDYPGSAQHVNKRNVSDGERINFSSGEIEPLIQTLAASAPDGGKFNLKQDSSRLGKGGEIQPLRQTSAAPPSDRNDVNLQKDSSGLGQHLPKQNMPDAGSSHLHQDIGSTGGDTIQLLKDYSSLQNASSDRSTKNVNPASGKTDLFSGVPSVMPEASSDSDGACDVPSDFNLCDVFDNEKHRLLTSQSLANHDSVTGDWTEQGLCIKCDNGGQLLSCSASGCSIGVHESCLGPFVKVEKTGLFYCPFCSFRRAAIAYCKAREKLSSAKNALSAFLGKDPIPGHRKEQSSPKVHRETSQADVAGNLSHQSAVPHADKLNVSFSTAQEEHQQLEVAKVCDKAKLCSKQMDNPSGVEGCDVSHNPVENKHDKMFKKVSFPDSEDADTIINVENELGNNSEHVWVAEHQQPTEPQEGIDNGNLPCEDRDTSTGVHAHDVSKAKQNSNIDSADDHLQTQHLKNQGQVEAFLDHDTGHKSPSPQTSEKHRESRRQHAAVGEACHTQGTVGDQSWNKVSPGKNLKYRSRPKRYSNPIIPSGRRKKLAWTVQEEEALKDAVQKFSVNSDGTLPWTKILEFGRRVFHKTRQPGDLKDKWRNIQIKEGLRTRKT